MFQLFLACLGSVMMVLYWSFFFSFLLSQRLFLIETLKRAFRWYHRHFYCSLANISLRTFSSSSMFERNIMRNNNPRFAAQIQVRVVNSMDKNRVSVSKRLHPKMEFFLGERHETLKYKNFFQQTSDAMKSFCNKVRSTIQIALSRSSSVIQVSMVSFLDLQLSTAGRTWHEMLTRLTHNHRKLVTKHLS